MGFLIDESLEVPGAEEVEEDKKGIQWGNLKTLQRLQRLLNTMLSAHDKQVINEFESLVVRLPAKGFGSTEFDMSDQRRDALIAAGRNVTRAYLEGLNDAEDSAFSLPSFSRSLGGGGAEKRAKKIADKLAMKLFGVQE